MSRPDSFGARSVRRALVIAVMLAATAGACRRTTNTSATRGRSVAATAERDVRCVKRVEGCIWCEGKGATAALVDPDAAPAWLCDPKNPSECVQFCSRLTAECAVPWHRSGPSCLMPNEHEFRRELYRRDTADRPETVVQGRVLDDTGRRVEGAKVRVWFQGTEILEESSAKDGTYRLRLRVGPGSYTVSVSHAGLATEIAELKLDKPAPLNRNFRLSAENVIKGRVVDPQGLPIPQVTIQALRNPDDPIDTGAGESGPDGAFAIGGLEPKRYFLRASKFGWLPATEKGVVAPARGVSIKLTRTGVIRGTVVDGEGEPQPNATVVALPSGSFGASSPIIWTVDAEGAFAQDRFQPGTYYLWARRGELLVYPPEKIEIEAPELEAEAELTLSHRGARVRGQVSAVNGPVPEGDARAVLIGRSPLALPRKAVGLIDHDGRFVVSALLPGRYELSVRVGGSRLLPITRGPRDVEIPIEGGVTVDLPETVVVRPQPEE